MAVEMSFTSMNGSLRATRLKETFTILCIHISYFQIKHVDTISIKHEQFIISMGMKSIFWTHVENNSTDENETS